MRAFLPFLAILLVSTLPATAQDWSLGVHSGPFVFGDFVERTVRPAAGGPVGTMTVTLSAATRAGLAVDLERSFAPRWAVRVEGTFTSAPLAVEQEGEEEGHELDAGQVDVSTFMLPLIFRINPRGAFRFHLMGGPAYALYRIEGRPNVSGITPLDKTSGKFGLAAGAGVAWWVSERFAIEGNISDVVTGSPFDREDFPATPGWRISRPHNVHTTVGARYRF